MTFVLSSQNVFDYLIEHQLCSEEARSNSQIELKYAKNFNLLVTLPTGHKLLVKQEPRDRTGKVAGEFVREWQIQALLQQFPELQQLRPYLSEAIHFNPDASVIVFNYLDHYRDLLDFYAKENIFPPDVASALGHAIAKLHCLTYNRADYQAFLEPTQPNDGLNQTARLVSNLNRITPEVFGAVPAEGLKFFALYQRYDSLGQAIAQLAAAVSPCCLTHNDLKLNNVLLSLDWAQLESTGDQMVRLIDWERTLWGDPAFDLGALVGSYVHLWLSSLVTSRTIQLEESLRMATTPLEVIQPSLAALATAYLTEFPQILNDRPGFLTQVVQFTGLSLITAIQSTLQYQKSFGNTGVCMLQVAKSLLCRPDASIRTVFGVDANELSSSLVPV